MTYQEMKVTIAGNSLTQFGEKNINLADSILDIGGDISKSMRRFKESLITIEGLKSGSSSSILYRKGDFLLFPIHLLEQGSDPRSTRGRGTATRK
ncbi:hypothetical protein RCO48_21820 [Peribacillus frigoritolerans]|nr:hypothetical protein [Peribacillus frigoritolerans]